MNNEGKDATLSRERVNEMKREAQNSLLPDEHKAEAVALCDMALRYRDVLEQEPVAWKERAEFAERKLAEAVAALKRIASNTCCDTCREAALVAQEAINEATK